MIEKTTNEQPSYPYFIRLCRKRAELITIVNEARNNQAPWSQDLVNRAITYILEDGNVAELSVFATPCQTPLHPYHALAVIAESITHSKIRQRKTRGASRASLIIPLSALPTDVQLNHTPQNNLDFAPADPFHYDLVLQDHKAAANTLLQAFSEGSITVTDITNDKKTYLLQAAIAMSYCLMHFSGLEEKVLPTQDRWHNGQNLTAEQQIDTLHYLTQEHGRLSGK